MLILIVILVIFFYAAFSKGQHDQSELNAVIRYNKTRELEESL